jgi:hypothetical protein
VANLDALALCQAANTICHCLTDCTDGSNAAESMQLVSSSEQHKLNSTLAAISLWCTLVRSLDFDACEREQSERIVQQLNSVIQELFAAVANHAWRNDAHFEADTTAVLELLNHTTEIVAQHLHRSSPVAPQSPIQQPGVEFGTNTSNMHPPLFTYQTTLESQYVWVHVYVCVYVSHSD